MSSTGKVQAQKSFVHAHHFTVLPRLHQLPFCKARLRARRVETVRHEESFAESFVKAAAEALGHARPTFRQLQKFTLCDHLRILTSSCSFAVCTQAQFEAAGAPSFVTTVAPALRNPCLHAASAALMKSILVPWMDIGTQLASSLLSSSPLSQSSDSAHLAFLAFLVHRQEPCSETKRDFFLIHDLNESVSISMRAVRLESATFSEAYVNVHGVVVEKVSMGEPNRERTRQRWGFHLTEQPSAA